MDLWHVVAFVSGALFGLTVDLLWRARKRRRLRFLVNADDVARAMKRGPPRDGRDGVGPAPTSPLDVLGVDLLARRYGLDPYTVIQKWPTPEDRAAVLTGGPYAAPTTGRDPAGCS